MAIAILAGHRRLHAVVKDLDRRTPPMAPKANM
jgi:hypothetical protein